MPWLFSMIIKENVLKTEREARNPVRIVLTQDDLDAGTRNQAYHCPLARACNRQLGGRWAIQPPLGWQHTNGYTKVRWWLSDAAMALVEAIDRKEPVTPCMLVLDDPTKAAHEV